MADYESNSIAQLENVLVMYGIYYNSFSESSSNAVATIDFAQISTAALAAIERITGKDSVYSEKARFYLDKGTISMSTINQIVGVVRALLGDIKAGFVSSYREIIHAELFSDFIEMAEYLLNEGYKDAAAVMVGGALEAHIRQLCIKHNISVENNGKPKKAEQLNSDLTKQRVYNILNQKNVTAWLDLRNKAAHAKYGEYAKEQVFYMLQGVQDFIARFPA